MATKSTKEANKSLESIVFIASDHAGFKLKQTLTIFLDKEGYNTNNLGPKTYEKSDDYPRFAKKLSKEVAKNKNAFGILICGSGIGMCIAANKTKGIRAANINNIKDAKSSRNDDNCNILCLSARTLTAKNAKKFTKTFLTTKFSNETRHKRRIKQIDKI